MKRKIRLAPNPVLIAGFDVLFIGDKGFSSLEKTKRFLIRAKGAPKKEPWIVLDVSRRRSAKTKQLALSKFIIDATSHSDRKLEEPKQKKKRRKRISSVDEIKFKQTGSVDKLIRSLDGKTREIRKLYFEVPESLQFVKSKDIDLMMISSYLSAVKREIKRIYKIYGKTDYLIRLTHAYKGMPSNMASDPEEKGFGGFSLNRQQFTSIADIDDQFDDVLGNDYPERFTQYLKFAQQNTYFQFTGFSAEMTTDIQNEESKLRKKIFTKTKAKLRKAKKAVKPKKLKKKTKKKVAKKVAKKKVAKKKKKPQTKRRKIGKHYYDV